jgi:hypothetical protein
MGLGLISHPCQLPHCSVHVVVFTHTWKGPLAPESPSCLMACWPVRPPQKALPLLGFDGMRSLGCIWGGSVAYFITVSNDFSTEEDLNTFYHSMNDRKWWKLLFPQDFQRHWGKCLTEVTSFNSYLTSFVMKRSFSVEVGGTNPMGQRRTKTQWKGNLSSITWQVCGKDRIGPWILEPTCFSPYF